MRKPAVITVDDAALGGSEATMDDEPAGGGPTARMQSENPSPHRVEALSDGVIAVAITLLVLDLRVPERDGGSDLAHRLGALWPNYLAYVISFVAIGIMWINHHAMLRRLAAVDQSVLVGNLLLLLCIVTLPFTTSLMSTYLSAAGPDGHLAAAVYAGSFLLTAGVFLALQRHLLLRRPQLLRVSLSPAERRTILLRSAVALPTYLLAGLLGLVSPLLTLAVCIGLGLFYLLEPLARHR